MYPQNMYCWGKGLFLTNSRHFITPLLIAFLAYKTRGHAVVGCEGGHHCDTNRTSLTSPPKLLSHGLTGGALIITSRSVWGGMRTFVVPVTLFGWRSHFLAVLPYLGKTAACVVILHLWMELLNLQHPFLFSSGGCSSSLPFCSL